MKRSRRNCESCFTFHIFLLLAFIPFSSSQSSDLIDQICKKTPFYDLCSSTLHSIPLSPNPNLEEVAAIMVNDIVANASDTLSYIEGLLKSTTDPKLQRALSLCAELYTEVVKFVLPEAANAISKNDFKLASYSVSVAMKDVSSCDKDLSGSSAQSLIGDRNKIVEKLLQVGDAIIKQGL